jgi:glyoxylase-like metal-dependent hydrolase (beta-lactamase superfamily II)
MADTVTIAPQIRQIDTLLGGHDCLTAGFLVEGPRPALVETGARSSTETVRRHLRELGLGPDDLAWIILTHVHLDHAGAVGDLAADFPSATVVVHERGARHLADPTRLVDSAARVYGELLDSLYGRMLPVAPERILAAGDGQRIDLGGGRRLTMVESPGHAKHHQAILDEETGTLLVGDAVGVLLPGAPALRPAVPPPDFDLELSVASLHRFAALRPHQVVLTHYGPLPDAAGGLVEAEETLRRWVEVAERVSRESEGAGIEEVAAALTEAFVPPPGAIDETARARMELLNGVHSNAAGIVRYLQRRGSRPEPRPAEAGGGGGGASSR